jgi:nitrate reductase cytochrome c-type subunit
MKPLSIVTILLSIIFFYGCVNTESNTINEENNNDNKTELNNIAKEKQIAMQAGSILGKNLLKAIHTEGTVGAITFCSDKAMHITDSISTDLNVKIKRVSDKNRNPLNAANDIELGYMEKVRESIAKGEKPSPQVIEEDNKILGYFPIMTNTMCLQCHGQKDIDISQIVALKIDSLYPNDNAINYKENELRGIWVIEMMK